MAEAQLFQTASQDQKRHSSTEDSGTHINVFFLSVMSAPTANQRKECWGARDKLWKCLDDNTTSCEKFQKEFEESCPAQWVKYFTKRRDFLKYKDKMEKEGFEPADGPKRSQS
ncbi:hypothetical protein DPEC_G00108190 [Dallia pectoralis]|uniref:Uncharacterized protein n=1 Tax=Dallia pectoralis TaxID=75939 RepID=A0ACC2GSE0_DALPE|nr:hypothetical protein DPEC_G00108190 [Dallia pectoralis]